MTPFEVNDDNVEELREAVADAFTNGETEITLTVTLSRTEVVQMLDEYDTQATAPTAKPTKKAKKATATKTNGSFGKGRMKATVKAFVLLGLSREEAEAKVAAGEVAPTPEPTASAPALTPNELEALEQESKK